MRSTRTRSGANLDVAPGAPELLTLEPELLVNLFRNAFRLGLGLQTSPALFERLRGMAGAHDLGNGVDGRVCAVERRGPHICDDGGGVSNC